jgi:hypothetical protein
VGGGVDVAAEIDAPESGAIELIGVQQDRTGVFADAAAPGVGGFPAEDDFIFAIAIQIAGAGVVGGVGVCGAIG